ncbi:ATPase/histidine kinase/DNA gyrase B/HSP90 domain protein [Aeromicrobium marinum DSM 15272]|uniref:histidine kinase n=1 Tax=Aeromicrobium marinum DSM 15272 TaxID=585531 RepID=E2S9J4_9ACTN|nr:ATP-binding protein [Aeromicrobium marinum]EFQ83918.1 ATPase/histidine kinase/DNA gyrase B/HSP90 domain protein [Aeromicrobium marinum DSM 15272]
MDLDDFPDGVIIAGPDGRVAYVNDRIRSLARATGDEMLGMPLDEAMPFDDLNGNTWMACTRPYDGLSTRTTITEQSWYSPRGSEYLVTAALVRDRPGGAVQRVILSVRSARARNHRDRERSDLVATVAHELRSPLTGIKGFTATLLSKWDQFSEEQRRFMLETVDADADRLSRLITELLDAARIDAGRLTLKRGPVRLDDLIGRVLRGVTAGGGDGRWALDLGRVPVVWGDDDRLVQVVTNLVENAQRHGHGLASLAVAEEVVDGRPGVRLHLVDRGPGIPEEMRMRVFSRFWRSGPGAGSGLGMYIVRGIVDQHGGRVDIDDAEGGGADISVWLPVNEPDTLTDPVP